MKRFQPTTLFIAFLLLLVANQSYAQTVTNRGKEFWLGYGNNSLFTLSGVMNTQELVLYLSAEQAATVTVSVNGTTYSQTYNIPANTVIQTSPIPKAGADDARIISEGKSERGIHVVSSTPIVAYAHQYGVNSSGATMLLPVAAYGYRYYSVNYTQRTNAPVAAYSWFFVVASENNTSVQITPSAPTEGGKAANVPFTVQLNKGEIYNVFGQSTGLNGSDLSGSSIVSLNGTDGITHPVGVFSGSSRMVMCSDNLGADSLSGDMIQQQVFPASAWGTTYLTYSTVRSSNTNLTNINYYRIAVSDPSTVVKKNGVVLNSLVNDFYYEFSSASGDYIEADKPILVAQYTPSSQCPSYSGDGDPEMFYLSPYEQAVKKSRFYSTSNQNILNNYVAVIINSTGVQSLRIDNSAAFDVNIPHPRHPLYRVVIKRIDADTAHTVQSDSAFTGITYGFGPVESYGYNIGAAFDSANVHPPKYNIIQGSLFLDNNANLVKDTNEIYFTAAKIVTTKPGVDTFSTVTSDGSFSFLVDTGSYVTAVKTNAPYFNVVPASHTSAFAAHDSTDSFSFAIQPIAAIRDLSVNLIPLGAARPGFSLKYKLVYQNNGTDTAGGNIVFVGSNKLNFASASVTPASVSADTLRWNLTGVEPGEAGSIIIDFTVKAPPAVAVGDTLYSSVTITSPANDSTPVDNVSSLAHRVTGSVDPNDKIEVHGGRLSHKDILQGKFLQYTIRFQNVGTDTAFNVYINDTLDGKLDWNTIKMVDASHSYTLTIKDRRYCSWVLKGINLVDSNKNEKLSHGYLTFIIKARTTISVGDTIRNKASIIFDFNLPLVTNTSKTVVVSEVMPLKLLSFTAVKAGSSNLLQWKTSEEESLRSFELQRSSNGKEFATVGTVKAGLNTYQFLDKEPLRAVNYYRLKIVNNDGSYEYSSIRKINNNGNYNISAYPNPAKDKLQVLFESDKTSGMDVQVLSLEGKVLLSERFNISQGSTAKAINLTSLQAGTYLLKTVSATNEQQIMKFQKL